MSKHLVPPVTIKTSAEIFNNEDGLALQRYSTFSGFKVNNISIPKLFPEFTDNDDHGTFVIPEKVGDDNFWPESETFMANCDKRKAFFFPHCFIPKILYALQPLAALRAGIYHIFQLIFGTENERQTKCALAKVNEKLFGTFQTYFDMVMGIWMQGYPANIPASLGPYWQDEMITEMIENMLSGSNTCLSMSPKLIVKFGLDPLGSENVLQEQTKIHQKLCKRNSKISSLLCLLTRECMLCGIDFATNNDLKVHMETECLKAHFKGTEENGITLFSCSICASVRMPYAQTVEHAATFCSRNFRSRCVYCETLTVRCKCTTSRATLMHIVQKMLVECKSFDLHNNAHRYISHVYSIYKMQLTSDILDGYIVLGRYEEEQLKPILLLNIRYNEGLQTHNEDGTESFHIVQQPSCGLNNDLPISFLLNSLEDAGVSLDINLIKYYSGNIDSNSMYVTAADAHINTSVDTYPKINQLCRFCWIDISNDAGHMSTNHPRCYCNQDRYQTPRELELHFKVHTLRNTNCPDKGCGASFDTIYDLCTHHTQHPLAEAREKIICSLDNRLNLSECLAQMLNPFKTIRHALLFHVKSTQQYNNFISMFPYIVTGNFDLNFDNDPYFSQENKYQIETKQTFVTQSLSGGDAQSLRALDGSKQNDSLDGQSLPLGGADNNNNGAYNAQGGQDPWDLCMKQVLKAKRKYFCENEDCMETNTNFISQEDLNNHVKRVHRCSKPGCLFSHMDGTILFNHTLTHKINNVDYVCNVCNKIFDDQAHLNNHMTQVHNLSCIVCHASQFNSRQALVDHSKTCNSASLDEKVGTNLKSVDGNDTSTMSLLLKALSESKMSDIPAHTLREIKSQELRQNQIKKAPELFIKKTDTLLDTIIFEQGIKPLSVPGARIGRLPKWEPVDDKPLCNYLNMVNLINEMVHMKVQYKLDEESFVSMLVSQFGTEAKNFIDSIAGSNGNLTQLPLERILEYARQIFFDIDLEHIHAQSKNLARNVGETSIAFFSRISSITKLASFYLEDEKERETYRHANVREQFLRSISRKFKYMIEQRELINGTIFPPAELFRMHIAFEQSENESGNKTKSINKVSSDIDIQQAFPPANKKKENKKGGNKNNKRRKNIPYSDEEYKGKQTNIKNTNKNQVRQVSSNEKKWEGPKPFKITDESVAKRQTLGFKGKGVICFLCRSTKHIAPHCRIYPDTKPTSIPCKCGLFHPESACKDKRTPQGNTPPQTGRVVRN